MKTSAFVISLERAALRFQNAHALLDQLPLPAEVLPAVDGSQLTDDAKNNCYTRFQHDPAYPFTLNAGEIGCFLSHRNAWSEILSRNLDAALVVEDDLRIDNTKLCRAIDTLIQSELGLGVVQLPVRSLPHDAVCVERNSQCSIVLPRVTPLRTSAQWVTRQAAKQLLRVTERFDRPIDTLLQMHWITGVPLYAISPSGLTDSTQEVGGSTIGGPRTSGINFEKVVREFRRTRYRWQISQLSTRHFRKSA